MGSGEIVLREYRETDLEAMFLLDVVCFAAAFQFDRASMRAFAGTRSAVTVVAEVTGGAMAGFVIAHVERTVAGRRGYIVTLDVAVEHRRVGVGERLLREAEGRLAAAGARWMELHVFTENESAIRFYERMGYEQVGLRRRFYGGDGLDAFRYRKELPVL